MCGYMPAIHPSPFPPRREAARERLSGFVPKADRSYATGRNFDRGKVEKQSVSCLSPYISRRMLTEEEVVTSVLERHELGQVEKYIQEVCWRTYWKGWLEQRPEIWREYLNELEETKQTWSEDAALEQKWKTAVAGRTNLTAFNHWVHELKTVGYLHNHARMWFAGIWIYDLGLPWQLGADFFFQNLLDRDAASNTLSWRWVAGLHTQGKRYVPSAGNIEKFTEGRFDEAGKLTCDKQGPEFDPHPERKPIAFPQDETEAPEVLLLHRDDFAMDLPEEWTENVRKVILLDIPSTFGRCEAADHVLEFDQSALYDAKARWDADFDCEILPLCELNTWWTKRNPHSCAIARAPVGLVQDALETVWTKTETRPRELVRDWDRTLWPLATAGFFGFWKKARKTLN